jgi:hypothetical protein
MLLRIHTGDLSPCGTCQTFKQNSTILFIHTDNLSPCDMQQNFKQAGTILFIHIDNLSSCDSSKTSNRPERYCSFILTIYLLVMRSRTSNRTERYCSSILTIYLLEEMWKLVFNCKFYLFLYFILTESRWVGNYCFTPNEPFSDISWRERVTNKFYSVSSLKQQSAGRHFNPLGHIILFPSQPFFSNTP